MKRVRIKITGRVQGVWFRKSACEKATELKLTGWVKNLNNGGVSAEAEGTINDVEQFITWCYQGSENSVVTGVEIEKLALEHDEAFMIKR